MANKGVVKMSTDNFIPFIVKGFPPPRCGAGEGGGTTTLGGQIAGTTLVNSPEGLKLRAWSQPAGGGGGISWLPGNPPCIMTFFRLLQSTSEPRAGISGLFQSVGKPLTLCV